MNTKVGPLNKGTLKDPIPTGIESEVSSANIYDVKSKAGYIDIRGGIKAKEDN